MFKISFYHIYEKKSYSFDISGFSIINGYLVLVVDLDFYSTSIQKFKLSDIIGLSFSYFPV